MIIDSHAHYDDEKYDEDREEVINSMHANGVEAVVNIGTSVQSSQNSIDLAHKYDNVYAVVGIHPDEIEGDIAEIIASIKAFASDEKVVAIGEIGLDYSYYKDNKELQKQWFDTQLRLAKELKLPFVIHSRDAAKDTFDMIKANHEEGVKGIIHCFSYSKEIAREYVKMGYYIGVGGVVTFKNAISLKEVVADIPIENIVLETDAPYLAPVPYRGKRNNSIYIKYIAEEIARIKGITTQEVIDITTDNTKNVYNLV